MANPQVLVVATTDLSHYLPQAKANQVDAQTIKLIENLQAETLLQKATRGENIMCGVGPVSSLLLAAKQLKTSRLQSRRLCGGYPGNLPPELRRQN